MIFIIVEIIFLFLFLGILFYFLEKNKKEEILFFILPVILFYFSFEAIWTLKGNGIYSHNFHFLFFGVPLIVPLAWVVVIFFAIQLTKKTFGKNKIIKRENFLLAISDGFWAVLFDALLLEPLAYYFVFWYHIGKENFLWRAPFLYFLGWFLSIFIMAVTYRGFKNFGPKKRFFLSYGFIFLLIIARFSLYIFLKI